MFEFKLQIACLIVVLYITIDYVRNTMDKKMPCNPYFDMILVFAPWAIVFDGVTACTVNFTEPIPRSWNLLLHFFMFLPYDIFAILLNPFEVRCFLVNYIINRCVQPLLCTMLHTVLKETVSVILCAVAELFVG